MEKFIIGLGIYLAFSAIACLVATLFAKEIE